MATKCVQQHNGLICYELNSRMHCDPSAPIFGVLCPSCLNVRRNCGLQRKGGRWTKGHREGLPGHRDLSIDEVRAPRPTFSTITFCANAK